MTSDLSVSFKCSCTILEVHALDYGVLAVFVLDFENRSLHVLLFLQLVFFGFLLFCVRKKIKLEVLALFLGVLLGYNMISDDIHSAHEKIFIDDSVKKVHRRFANELCRGGVASDVLT